MTPEQTTINYVKAAVTKAFSGIGFFQHGTDIENSLSSNEETPQVFLFDPRPRQANHDSRVVTLSCTMTFLDAEPGDGDDPVEGAAAIDRMSTLKDRFFTYLDRNPLLEIQSIEWESERQVYSGRFTGVAVRFLLVVPRPFGYTLCTSPDPNPEPLGIFSKVFAKVFK